MRLYLKHQYEVRKLTGYYYYWSKQERNGEGEGITIEKLVTKSLSAQLCVIKY